MCACACACACACTRACGRGRVCVCVCVHACVHVHACMHIMCAVHQCLHVIIVLFIKLEGARASTGFCVDVKPYAHGRIGRVAPPHDAFLRPIYSCAGHRRAAGGRAGDLAGQLAL